MKSKKTTTTTKVYVNKLKEWKRDWEKKVKSQSIYPLNTEINLKKNISDSSHIQHTHTQREGIEKKRDY